MNFLDSYNSLSYFLYCLRVCIILCFYFLSFTHMFTLLITSNNSHWSLFFFVALFSLISFWGTIFPFFISLRIICNVLLLFSMIHCLLISYWSTISVPWSFIITLLLLYYYFFFFIAVVINFLLMCNFLFFFPSPESRVTRQVSARGIERGVSRYRQLFLHCYTVPKLYKFNNIHWTDTSPVLYIYTQLLDTKLIRETFL